MRRHRLLLGAVIVAVTVLRGAVALAAPPSITAITPADGTTVTGGFTMRFEATDPDTVPAWNARVVVGETTITPQYSYPRGYWEGEGCDAHWVEDRTFASFSANIPNLPGGTYSIRITVPDARGEVATATRTFTRTVPMTYSSSVPLAGGRYRSVDLIRLIASGPSIATSTAVVRVDGAVVASSASTLTTTSALVSAPVSLGSGAHDVSVSIGDGTNVPMSPYAWSFRIDPSATPPSIGGQNPAPGATVQGPFQLGYHVTDPEGVNGYAARLFVNDVAYTGTAAYPGHWEPTSDGCDVYWVEDRTQCDLTFSVPDLGPGTHRLRLDVPDEQGSVAVSESTILRGAELAASGMYPAPESRSGNVGAFGVTLTGAGIDPATIVLTLDGAPVPHTFTPSATGGLVEASVPIGSGRHTARVSASDVFGSPPMATSWSFVVDATPPAVRSVTPADGGTLKLADAGIVVRLSDDDGIAPSSVVLRLDGVQMSRTVTADGADTVVSWSGVLPEGSHAASITAADVAGNAMTRTWAFSVADPPRFGTPSPLDSPSGANARVAVPVRDVNQPLSSAVTMTIDGVAVPAVLSTTDPRTGTVSADVTGLAHGSHNVTVTAGDTAGNTATTSWAFTVDARAPQASGQYPSPGGVVSNGQVAMGLRFDDENRIDLTKTRAWVDGQAVAASAVHDGRYVGDSCNAVWVEEPNTAIVSLNRRLLDGQHTLRITAEDAFGNARTVEWSFVVKEHPTISSLLPKPSSRTTASVSYVSATVRDNDGVSRIVVEARRANAQQAPGPWQVLASTYETATGVLRASLTPPAPDVRYELRVTATDVGTLVTSTTTSVFFASDAPQMSAGANCDSCHTNSTVNHPRMNECTLCHGSPIGPCGGSGCHGSPLHDATWMSGQTFVDHGGSYTGRTCANCHEHGRDTEVQRHSTSDAADCQPCHSQSLTVEHTGKTSSAGASFGCNTCHKSTETSVTAAITASDIRCGSCHARSGHRASHESSPLASACEGCHDSANLVAEHLENSGTQEVKLACVTCHRASSRETSASIAAGNRQCASCHRTPHGMRFAESPPGDIPLHPDVAWSLPEDAALFAGLSWMPADLAEGGRVLNSSRAAGLTPTAAWNWLRTEMLEQGWTLESGGIADGGAKFEARFSKGKRKAVVRFFGDSQHGSGSAPGVPCRFEVIYR